MERPNELRSVVQKGNRDNALKSRIYPFEYICKFLLKCRDRLIRCEVNETLAITDLAKESKQMLALLNSLKDSVVGDEKLCRLVNVLIDRQRDTVESIAQLEMDISEKNPIIEDMSNMLQQADPILNRLVFKDSLTSAYNRYFFACNIERLFEMENENSALSMAFIDIDGFREIDSAYGHDVGDDVLYKVEAILTKNMRGFENSYVIRMGGDEFVLLSLDLQYESFIALMDAVRQDISQLTLPVTEQGDIKSVTVSIGCANRERDNVANYMHLFQTADGRLCKAKSQGKNCIAFE